MMNALPISNGRKRWRCCSISNCSCTTTLMRMMITPKCVGGTCLDGAYHHLPADASFTPELVCGNTCCPIFCELKNKCTASPPKMNAPGMEMPSPSQWRKAYGLRRDHFECGQLRDSMFRTICNRFFLLDVPSSCPYVRGDSRQPLGMIAMQ
eukprot:gnl/TRDRNA2_/TRDRNA2_208069_c0_seq1.p1 gnl/TRDRNA2_/TRDRNA2_208069_c0~~gnl/TRDRNA2_/TRDRNA2_208069_c0_seq1.p1  ORF type:complete len:152 (+),score=8.64 gnl/TRDRNA2_/TRDRNA2_208069_c0_seq1:310-765(+)